jgi:hypothetical protein
MSIFGGFSFQVENNGWTRLEPYQETEIYFDPKTGSFWANINGKEVKRAKLSDIHKVVNQVGRPVKALHVSATLSYATPRNIIRAGAPRPNSAEVQFVDDKQQAHSAYRAGYAWASYASTFYVYDAEAHAAFNQLLEERNQLNERWKALCGTLRELTADELKVLQAEAALDDIKGED